MFCLFLCLSTVLYAEIVRVPFETINRGVANICSAIDRENVDVLVGICAGGLPPTTLFSKYLANKNIQVISASSYSEEHQQKDLRVWNLPARESIEGKNVLLIDDIADSGKTLSVIKQILLEELGANSVTTTTVFINVEHCVFYPDLWAFETLNWIVFPWEELY